MGRNRTEEGMDLPDSNIDQVSFSRGNRIHGGARLSEHRVAVALAPFLLAGLFGRPLHAWPAPIDYGPELLRLGRQKATVTARAG